eukprot:GHVP01031554.1.p1 GENE.GHVP01031554.1~~GHVP01031554.1.p1  ORF type:complete len:512 (-),score=75.90 GHVP01031554.1:159-1694(-)
MGNAEGCLGGGSEVLVEPSQYSLQTSKLSNSAVIEALEKVKRDALKNWNESISQRYDRYKGYLTISLEQMERFRDEFMDELQRGLESHKKSPSKWLPEECSFKMLDSFCRDIPNGTELGVFYSIDFGGTNVRSVRCELLGNGQMDSEQYRIPLSSADVNTVNGLMDSKATATQLFDFLAKATKFFMKKRGDLEGDTIPVGFTFSFPATQFAADSAELIVWTKGFQTGRETRDPVEGQDVGALLNHAFQRNSVPAVTAVVANDTVGTLLSGAYESAGDDTTPAVRIGMIIGTGFNACYVEEKAQQYGYVGKIVNIESGNFNRTSLPRTNVDLEIDFSAVDNRGQQLLEKMVAGAYLGEASRRVTLKVLQELAPAKAWDIGSLTAEDASIMMLDDTSDCKQVCKFLREKWEVADPKPEVIKVVKDVCTLIYDRSATLVACLVAAISEKTGYLQAAKGGLTVAVDGSLFVHNHVYREKMRLCLNDLLGEETASLINFVVADDGSGKGAAVFAAL